MHSSVYITLGLIACLETTLSFSPLSSGFVTRAGFPALRLSPHAQRRSAFGQPLCSMKLDGLLLAQAAASAPAATAPAQAVSQAVKAAEQAAPAVKATVEGVVPKAVEEPSLMQTIVGGDSLILTLMATIVLILGIVVTASTGYITYASWQEDQDRKKIRDPNSQEYKDFVRDITVLERDTKGRVSSKGRAMKEAMEVDDGEKKPMGNSLLAEPGNRDARRAKAKRDRVQASKEQQVAKVRKERSKKPEESGLSSFSSDNNKGFFDSFMDQFK